MTDGIVIHRSPGDPPVDAHDWELQAVYKDEPVLQPVKVVSPPPPDGGRWIIEGHWTAPTTVKETPIDSVAVMCDGTWVTIGPVEPPVLLCGPIHLRVEKPNRRFPASLLDTLDYQSQLFTLFLQGWLRGWRMGPETFRYTWHTAITFRYQDDPVTASGG